MKYGGYRSKFAATLARLMKSKLFRGCVAFFVVTLFYIGLFAGNDSDYRFEVFGGFVGAISSVRRFTQFIWISKMSKIVPLCINSHL